MAGATLSDVCDWLVVGGTGQVGGALLRLLGPRAISAGRSPANPCLVDLEQLAEEPGQADRLMAEARPRTVVIAAAATNVDRCESEPAMANAVNATAPAALARAAHRIGAKTVFVSTEYVFDGEAGPYDEDAEPRPLSVYGSSKAAGEQAVLSADPDAIVVRTTVVYGPERQGRNFAYRLAGHLRAGKVLRVPADQISTPTYNRDLATALVQLAQSSLRGIVHVAGPCLLGRDGFAVEVAREAGLDGTLIESVKTASLSQVARRPLRAGLISRRANEWGSHPVRGTAAAVADWRGDTYGLTWP